MTTASRIALVIGALCLLGVGLATFLPTSPAGATCGTWVAPEWTDEKVAVFADTSAADELAGVNVDGSLSDLVGQRYAIADAAVASKLLCDDALSTRRTTSLVLLVLAAVVPAGIVFIGRGRRSDARSASDIPA